MASLQLPQHESSYWITSTVDPGYPALNGDISIDVAVIGAGIAGLSTAYYLKQSGLTVAVLEQQTIGAKVTGHTTGKVTSQHNLCYSRLIRDVGAKQARLYGQANQQAIDQIEQIIAAEHINCDWQRDDNYVFTTEPSEVTKLREEARAAHSLGLPASFTTKTDLPFKVKGAVRFTNQAKFHARKYLLGLAKAIDGGGSYIFEHTRALTVQDGNPCSVPTVKGTVTAKHVVVATNVPFPLLAHAYYAAYEYPLKSYIVAAKVDRSIVPKGMYITPGNPTRSILPFTADGQHWLLIGGESHFPGLGNERDRHQRLADYAARQFGITNITHRWSTWDYISNDRIPLIGKLQPWSKHVYTATGFMKWGLSTGTVAGLLLRDAILGQANPWADVFKTDRLSPVLSLPKAVLRILRSG